MRVLWFTNVPLPQVAAAARLGTSGGGHWMSELFRAVAGTPGLSLGVATAFPGLRDMIFDQDGATFYATGQNRRAATFAGTRTELEKCAAMVREFKPDLVHFHGSERFFGLLKAEGMVQAPAVLSLQGLLGPCSQWRTFFGSLTPWEIARSIRLVEIPLRLGLAWQYYDMRRGARNERRILASVEGFLGRTAWDEAYARALNPRAFYCTVGEIMRAPFYETHWSPDRCEPHTLIYTHAGHPIRGTPNLLAAAALLRAEFPALRLRLAGIVSERGGYGRFLRRRVRELGLGDCVEFLGQLDGSALARELARANAFVTTSWLENSPNSLAEAMLVGMPCVASRVGGISSMVEEGRTGLLYGAGDVALLAAQIARVFREPETAARLGAAAREIALERHDPALVAGQLMTAYRRALGAPVTLEATAERA